METILLIRSSSHPDEPYEMRFSNEDDGVKLRCYCPAGREQTLCKHVIGLLEGNREILFHSTTAHLFDEIYTALETVGAVDYCQKMSREIKDLERAFRAARTALRERLCDTLRNGGSFL